MRILEIIRLSEQGFTQREVAASANCGKTTVGDIQRRCAESGLDYEEASTMTNKEIQARLYPLMADPPTKDDPDWEELHRWLKGGKRRNLSYAWETYRADNPGGLGYSQYCRRYKKWRENTGKTVAMVQNHEPGKELYIDWAGDTLDCVANPETGELSTAHFFVAVMGCSCYPYVEAFPSEGQLHWINGHIHAFEHLGGVPMVGIPDNCKTAVTKANYYDPKLNPAYFELAKHYGIAIIPARVKRPKDKSLVEGSIGWLETWLLEWLRGQAFFSFEDLNKAIKGRVAALARRGFKERHGSRLSVFEELDKPNLRPLPSARFQTAAYAARTVPDNYHVEYDGFYYSVPYTFYKQLVTVRATATMIEVVSSNRESIALHPRRYAGRRYATNIEHMPESHRKQVENSKRTGRDYLEWGSTIGASTREVIDKILKSQEVEMTAYRSCMGVLQCAKKHGREKLEDACAKALNMGSPCYTTIKTLISNPSKEAGPARSLPRHENLRSPAEFV